MLGYPQDYTANDRQALNLQHEERSNGIGSLYDWLPAPRLTCQPRPVTFQGRKTITGAPRGNVTIPILIIPAAK